MGIGKYNHEGYYDPVPYEAVKNIESKAKKQHPCHGNQKCGRINHKPVQNNQKSGHGNHRNQCVNQKTAWESQKNQSISRSIALRDIQTFKSAYICSPLRGDMELNINMARTYCRFAVINGYAPIATHLLFPQFMDDNDETERDVALRMGIVLLSKCEAILVFGDTISSGMRSEIDEANRLGIPVRYFNNCCREMR